MLCFPTFSDEFEQSERLVLDFMENVPILRKGNHSAVLEPKYFDIRSILDWSICPSTSFWNLENDYDETLSLLPNNQRYYSELQEESIAAMSYYLKQVRFKGELEDWILFAMGSAEFKQKIRDRLYDHSMTDCLK